MRAFALYARAASRAARALAAGMARCCCRRTCRPATGMSAYVGRRRKEEAWRHGGGRRPRRICAYADGGRMYGMLTGRRGGQRRGMGGGGDVALRAGASGARRAARRGRSVRRRRRMRGQGGIDVGGWRCASRHLKRAGRAAGGGRRRCSAGRAQRLLLVFSVARRRALFRAGCRRRQHRAPPPYLALPALAARLLYICRRLPRHGATRAHFSLLHRGSSKSALRRRACTVISRRASWADANRSRPC